MVTEQITVKKTDLSEITEGTDNIELGKRKATLEENGIFIGTHAGENIPCGYRNTTTLGDLSAEQREKILKHFKINTDNSCLGWPHKQKEGNIKDDPT